MSVEAKAGEVVASDLISVFIDDTEVKVPKGTLVIRAAEMIGVDIPRFCDHPLLDPVGACRECMVEVPDMGNGRGMPKPQASCTLECAPGMQVKTQVSSEKADKAQRGILEFLLINHPLDCPICDKGGECPLQNQAMSNGRGETRYEGVKRTFPKPVSISAQILLDRERCVLCARCTRFSEQISGDPFIALVERGALQQVGIYAEHPYDSYFSGNVIQICPVGALTSADYRFQARPFDLVSTTTTCEHCAAGCQLRTDHRHYQVKRRLAGNPPRSTRSGTATVGRFAFRSGRQADRLTTPLVRENGELRVGFLARGHRRRRDGPEGCRVERGRPHRRPAHHGERLRVRQVHPRGPGHEQHRLPRSRLASDEEAQFLGRRGGWQVAWVRASPTPTSAEGHQGHLRGVRARGRVADRLPAPPQGSPQEQACRSPRWRPTCPMGPSSSARPSCRALPVNRGRRSRGVWTPTPAPSSWSVSALPRSWGCSRP